MRTREKEHILVWPFRQVCLFVLLAALCIAPLTAQNTGADSISHKALSNGLEVFAVENHSVPLVTICVAFRGGASAQTAETAGLFHLYEHMLFAGNAAFPTKESFNAALNAMGTTTWNGATGTEFINYHITVPSDKLTDGVAFWAAAVRSPIFDPKVLENEKQVVLSEVKGYQADPARLAVNALESRMFRDFPWRKNVDGPTSNIEGATVDSLKAIQAQFYIPSNMALMIGGDIAPGEVFALADRFFGDWKGGPAPVIGEPPHGPIPPDIRVIATDDLYYRGLAQVQFRWRGPDVLRQTRDTYVSDIFLFLLSSPVGNFKKNLMDKVAGLYDPEYIDFSYPTARDGGNFVFNTYFTVQNPKSEGAVLDRVEGLKSAVLSEFAEIAADPQRYFGAEELEKAKTKLIDQNLYAMESAEDFITDTLTFWWSTATAQYFFAYEANCRDVVWTDISRLLSDYILGGIAKPAPAAAALVRLRSSTAGSDLKMADRIKELGYIKATTDTAFWWQH